ncbi:hypothetical protein [Rossellomorea sp. RS05]|uniref:hypothetical protein n=1 Tax=Rossellomorea sp. RS05 TaxID=3149166 RepID=UPI003221DC4F
MKKLIIMLVALSFIVMGCSQSTSSDEKSEKKESTQTEKKEDSKKEEATKDESKEETDKEDTAKKEEPKKDLSDAEKQEALITYINDDVRKIADYETEAVVALQGVSGENYTNDEDMYEVLTKEVIPTYEKAVDTAENIESPFDELEPMTAKLKDIVATYHEALMLQKEGIEKQDVSLIEDSNAKAQEYLLAAQEYHMAMSDLAKKYDVDYQPDNQQFSN